MKKSFNKLSKTAGNMPGELVHIGEKKADKTKISIIDYNETHFTEKEARNIEECFAFKQTSSVTWINIDGIHDIEIINKIGKQFDLHPLVLEDILNTEQRPKYEDLDKHLFIVLKMIMFDKETNDLSSEQVSILLAKNLVISFQEKEGDVFAPIRDRLRNDKGRIRKMGADYLAYALLDAIVDSYYLFLEKIGEKIEEIEEDLLANPSPKILQVIHNLKQDTIYLRKSIWPLREVVNSLERGESELIMKSTKIFLRDVYDHTIQVIDTIETFRDMISGMLDIYLSSVSNRMNEIMKVLTIFAAIFIPLTFIVGIYGMNFEFIPELKWKWGYFGLLGIMATLGIGMLLYFRKKKWL